MLRNSRRQGLTLLEVLVALTILGIASAAWAAQLHEGVHAVRLARQRETETETAAALLTRMSVWSRSELSANLGRRRMHGLEVTVSPLSPSLYGATVVDTIHGATLLVTSFYVRDANALAPR
jgi:prepilin-type N-terminal cleavage/methylation domain-containing protein